MKVAEILSGVTSVETATPCRAARMFTEEMDQEDRDAIERAIQNGVSIRQIHQALRNSGIKIGRDVLSVHVVRKCTCNSGNGESK